MRRHPDARLRLHLAAFTRLAQRQARLLDAAAPLVRPGGLLIYATCSLEPEENEAVVRAFLGARPDFATDPPDAFPVPLDADGWLRCLPHRHGTDGFTAVRFHRS